MNMQINGITLHIRLHSISVLTIDVSFKRNSSSYNEQRYNNLTPSEVRPTFRESRSGLQTDRLRWSQSDRRNASRVRFVRDGGPSDRAIHGAGSRSRPAHCSELSSIRSRFHRPSTLLPDSSSSSPSSRPQRRRSHTRKAFHSPSSEDRSDPARPP